MMNKYLVLLILFLAGPVFAAPTWDVPNAPTASTMGATDSIVVVDDEQVAGQKVRRVLFQGDAAYLINGIGEWVVIPNINNLGLDSVGGADGLVDVEAGGTASDSPEAARQALRIGSWVTGSNYNENDFVVSPADTQLYVAIQTVTNSTSDPSLDELNFSCRTCFTGYSNPTADSEQYTRVFDGVTATWERADYNGLDNLPVIPDPADLGDIGTDNVVATGTVQATGGTYSGLSLEDNPAGTSLPPWTIAVLNGEWGKTDGSGVFYADAEQGVPTDPWDINVDGTSLDGFTGTMGTMEVADGYFQGTLSSEVATIRYDTALSSSECYAEAVTEYNSRATAGIGGIAFGMSGTTYDGYSISVVDGNWQLSNIQAAYLQPLEIGPAFVDPGEFFTVAIDYSSGAVKVYLDGVLTWTTTATITPDGNYLGIITPWSIYIRIDSFRARAL